MYEFFLFKDGEELLRCTSLSYLKAFIEDHYKFDDCLWVRFKGEWFPSEDFINNWSNDE